MTDIPPLLPPDQMPPVTDQASLERTWRALMGQLGFGSPQLWILFLRDGRCLNLVEIDEMPLSPGPGDIDRLAHLLGHLDLHGPDCAFLFARPGRPGLTAGDLAWARGLSGMYDDGWPVHLANDIELRVAAPDDLAQAG